MSEAQGNQLFRLRSWDAVGLWASSSSKPVPFLAIPHYLWSQEGTGQGEQRLARMLAEKVASGAGAEWNLLGGLPLDVC